MTINFSSFPKKIDACVFGATGGLGSAFVEQLCAADRVNRVYTVSRSEASVLHEKITPFVIDQFDGENLASIGNKIERPLSIVIVATGLLHSPHFQPEKSMRDIEQSNFEEVFNANCFIPALIAKHIIPRMDKNKKSVFSAISARVGSISDNNIGGWYAYRASKAALNMVIKNLSIELSRRHKELIILGLHPGTVDTKLSRPFQRNIKHEIFPPFAAASKLLNVIDKADTTKNGTCLDYNGQEILP